VRTISNVLGREIRFVELTQDEIVAEWRTTGYSDEDIEFFLAMRTNPPEAGYTVLPTVEKVTGKPARAFAQWVSYGRTPRPSVPDAALGFHQNGDQHCSAGNEIVLLLLTRCGASALTSVTQT
jgi:hypothetical protein